MKSPSIQFYIITVGLLGLNIYQVFQKARLSNEISVLQGKYADTEKEISIDKAQSDAVGSRFSFASLTPVKSMNYSKDIEYKLVGFFSSRDCRTCVLDEIAELDQLAKNDKRIIISAVCVDSAKGNAYRFVSDFFPSFTVFHGFEKQKTSLPVPKTPFVILLDRKNKVMLTHISEVGETVKRTSFYNKVLSLIN